jgi:hypothetical protein
MKFEVPGSKFWEPRTSDIELSPVSAFVSASNSELITSSPGYPVSLVPLFSHVSHEYLIVRWFEVARWAILPGDRRLLGLFDEATQIYFRCTEQLRFAALDDSGQ